MTIPLSLAIISGLLVRIGDEKYIVPLSSIHATIQVEKEAVKSIQGNRIIMFRDKVLPLLYASELLNVSSAHGDEDKKVTVIVIEKAGKPLGLVVDSFESKQDIVLKRIDKVGYGPIANAPTEATILSDGRVALILDTTQLEARKV
jgi:two-component system chemotaxis sensor kinase CheA